MACFANLQVIQNYKQKFSSRENLLNLIRIQEDSVMLNLIEKYYVKF